MRASGRVAHEYAAANPSSVSAANLAADYEALALQVLDVLEDLWSQQQGQ